MTSAWPTGMPSTSNCTVASGYNCLSVLAKGEDCAMPKDATTLFGSF